jgi:hypothetical protein
VTAVNTSGVGRIQVYPGPADPNGANKPTASLLNYLGQSTVTNASTLTLSANGSINVFSSAGTDLLIDVAGYFAPANTTDPNSFSTGLSYYQLSKPIRALDTRVGTQALYTPSNGNTRFNAGNINNYVLSSITYLGITIPPAAKALTANTTVVGTSSGGRIQVYLGPADPTGANKPVASLLNFLSQATVANSHTLTLGSDGSINVFSSAATDLLIDIAGYFAPNVVPAV